MKYRPGYNVYMCEPQQYYVTDLIHICNLKECCILWFRSKISPVIVYI